MDSFFGVGLPELIMILLVAGLLLGPQRIRQAARTLGRLTAQLQRISREFRRQLNTELDALDSGELRGAVQDMQELKRQMADLRREVASIPKELNKERSTLAEEARALVQEQDALVQKQITTGHAPAALPGHQDFLPQPLKVADDPD
ncbi:MAG: twin-arginine translocase TatA/TatE family subunit [Chloroflexota bacterium]